MALTSNIPSAGPAFSAYANADQNITSATVTKVLFQTETFDTNNNFSSSRFTPTVAGYYQVNCGIDGSNSAGTQTRIILFIHKNGSALYRTADFANSTTYTVNGSGLVYCNGSTDYIEIYAYITAVSPQITGGSEYTYFNGSMVRGA